LIDDYDLVVSSFQTQYGLRLAREIHEMPWEEFKQLLSGIGPETPLGRIVAIRSETDKEILKHFSKEQRRIRNEWLQRRAKTVSESDMQQILEGFKQAFVSMAGGG
jgi:hypothetical protein